MIIGIDVDGTLTNLIDRVISYGQEYEIENNLEDGVQNPLTDYYEYAFSWGSEIGSKFWRDNIKTIANTSPRPLVKKYLDLLHQKGHQIYIVTARTDEEFGDAKKYTEKWLKKYKLHYDKIFTNASNKGQVCVENGIQIFLDDLSFNCDSTASVGVKTFMMYSIISEKYNNPLVQKVYSFVDFYKQVIKYTEEEPKNKTYIFSVNKKIFKKIKNKEKIVDFRINDLRKHNIKVGDKVVFRMNENFNKQIFGDVLETKTAKNFVEIIKYYGIKDCGFAKKSLIEADKIMHRYYSDEEINKFGVIGIKFKINE